jgi:hypothetical protein
VKRAKLKRKIGLSSDGAELSSVDAASAWSSAVSPLKQGIIEGENPVFLLLSYRVYDLCLSSRVVWDCSSKSVVSFIES